MHQCIYTINVKFKESNMNDIKDTFLRKMKEENHDHSYAMMNISRREHKSGKYDFSEMANVELISCLERQLQCIHFLQRSEFVHWIHSFLSTPSMMSSSYAPKQTEHSLEQISADCRPLSLGLACFLLLSVCLSFSTTFFVEVWPFFFFQLPFRWLYISFPILFLQLSSSSQVLSFSLLQLF